VTLEPEQDNALLDRFLEETRRTRETVLAAAFVAVNGVLFIMQAVQAWAFLWVYGFYVYVPPVLLVLGLVLVVLASKIYSQRVWAVVAATVTAGLSAVVLGTWYIVVSQSAAIHPLATVLPFAAAVAGACAGAAIAPCLRTREARKRAAAAGFDLDF
jgi:hypothetical protein